jgi:hypothetical protein
LNLTPSEDLAGSAHVQDSNLSGLLPMLKILTQSGWRDSVLNVELLDLSRRRVVFHQEDVHSFDWREMRGVLEEKNTGVIDLKSLQDRAHNAAFFVKEVARKIGADPADRVPIVIVLSSSVSFASGEDLHPISARVPPGGHIFYIRYHPPPHRNVATNPFENRGRGGRPMGGLGRQRGPLPGNRDLHVDQLASTLKPLSPRIFDIETPEQFRKALAAILAEIGGS